VCIVGFQKLFPAVAGARPYTDKPAHVMSSPVVYEYNNARKAEQILIKFGVDVMTVEAVPNACSLISYNPQYQRDRCWNLWREVMTALPAPGDVSTPWAVLFPYLVWHE
jgi:hypothetical protein